LASREAGIGHGPIKLNRTVAWKSRWTMMFSENRLPLFGIMLDRIYILLALPWNSPEFSAE
jgi:hypothetical protein